MNKKIILIFVLFSFSLLVIAGCQEAKGTRVSNKVAATAEKTMEGKPIIPSDFNYVGCELNKECLLNTGDYTLIDNKKITLNRVGSGGHVIVDIDGVSVAISSNQEKKISTDGFTIKNLKSFYDLNDNSLSSAALTFSYVTITSPINRTTNTTGSVMEEIKLRSNGEYKLLDGGAIKISCNRVRGSKPAFTNNTVFYLNGSFSGSAEHNLIPGEYTTAFNKKYSCNN